MRTSYPIFATLLVTVASALVAPPPTLALPTRANTIVHLPSSNHTLEYRAVFDSLTKLLDPMNAVALGAQQLNAHAASATSNGENLDYLKQSPKALRTVYDALAAINNALAPLAVDKGLANYDQSDRLETLLKGTVNAVKNALTSTDILVYRIPILGPELGPIVYQIKCIVDDLLDLTENVTDGLLNKLAPILRPLSNQLVGILCDPILAALNPIVGLCG